MNKFQDIITQLWVRSTGRKINPDEHSWLIGPIGSPDIIADKYISHLCNESDLEIARNVSGAGLLESIEDIGINGEEKSGLNPKIIDFYEKTADYDFEIWSEWKGIFKPFGKILALVFSKRLQQLNLPLSALDSSKGVESEIIKLKESQSGKNVWTVWFRKLKSTGDVIYSGVYTTCNNPEYKSPLLKVVFPLPNGNASVVMTKKVLEDGSLLLSSDGNKFGKNGFYFTLTDHKGNYFAKYVKAMHEWIKVYVDKEDVLRTDHILNFYGMNFLKLHYKITKKAGLQ